MDFTHGMFDDIKDDEFEAAVEAIAKKLLTEKSDKPAATQLRYMTHVFAKTLDCVASDMKEGKGKLLN